MGCEKMSKFLLQTDAMEIEEKIAKEQLDRTKLVHSYKECTLSDLDFVKEKDFNPIGTIQFVEKYLGITETPIEIPKYLQTEEFLKREYKIVKGKDLPRGGRYFVKNASKLKDFSVNADMEYFLYDEIAKGHLSASMFLFINLLQAFLSYTLALLPGLFSHSLLFVILNQFSSSLTSLRISSIIDIISSYPLIIYSSIIQSNPRKTFCCLTKKLLFHIALLSYSVQINLNS